MKRFLYSNHTYARLYTLKIMKNYIYIYISKLEKTWEIKEMIHSLILHIVKN
jgi:hypothetical protein